MTTSVLRKYDRCFHLKLEPIIQLDDDALFGYEVLSHLPGIVDVDTWFKQQPLELLLQLFHDQTQSLIFPKSTTRFFLNLPIKALLSTVSFMDILALCRPELMIEIQDARAFFTLDGAERLRVQRNIARLEYTGTAIWLDDLNAKSITAFAAAGWRISGVKLDKTSFWRLSRSPKRLQQTLNQARQFASMVLVEGVETAEQRDIAQWAGAHLGQGFFWPTLFCQKE